MTRILRFAKRFALPALLAGVLLVVAQVVFAAPPIPSFEFTVQPGTPVTGCKSVSFSSQTTDPDADLDTIEWDWNSDGVYDDSGDAITHVFDTAGTHTVTMRATDLDTAGDGIEQATVQHDVVLANTLPTATIAVLPNPPQAGQAASFTATPTDDGTIAGYAWDFGDGGTGTGASAPHTFDDHAAHTVGVTLTDNCGEQGTASLPVTPGNTAPAVPAPTATVLATPVTVVNPGDQVSFAAAPTDANNDAMTYAWDLDGDGQFDDSMLPAPTHVYPATATAANVRVQVSDNVAGTPATASPALALRINQAPVVELSNDPESPAVGEGVKFDASTSHDDDSPGALTYAWDLDGTGTYVAGSAKPPAHVYTKVGDVTVGVHVTDSDGRMTPFTKTITVQKTRPTARLRYSPTYPVPGQTVTLTSTSVPSNTAGAPAIQLTQWDFDYDATGAFAPAASGTTRTTSFSTAGVHTVAVRVTDGSNGTDIASASIVVNARPKASFTIRPAKPREGSEITFISTSSDPDGPVAKQEWDLDNDGRYDDGTGVVAAKKLKQGTRTVRMRVTDSKGATDVSTQKVKVYAKSLDEAPDVNKTLGYARRSWGIQVVALYVSVPARTTVKVTCKGRGCPHGTFVKRSKKKSTQLRFTKFRGFLKAGAKITVISYRHGSIAEYFIYTVRGDHKPPLKRKRCKALSAKKYGSCG